MLLAVATRLAVGLHTGLHPFTLSSATHQSKWFQGGNCTLKQPGAFTGPAARRKYIVCTNAEMMTLLSASKTYWRITSSLKVLALLTLDITQDSLSHDCRHVTSLLSLL